MKYKNIFSRLLLSELHFLLALRDARQMYPKAFRSLDESIIKTYHYHVMLFYGRRVTEYVEIHL